MTDAIHNLPRLLYISEVPARSTLAGAALVYRLLSEYPPERLRVYESHLFPPTGPMLPGVDYRAFDAGNHRLLSSRFAPWYRMYLYFSTRRRARKLATQIVKDDYKPEAILTVAHGTGWLVAAEVARQFNLPLHLIVHDDPYLSALVPSVLLKRYVKTFGRLYKAAASRMNVSPYMAEKFKKDFGIDGDVIYPSRAAAGPVFSTVPDRLAEDRKSLTFAYAGSISTESFADLIVALAEVLTDRGHRLLVFSNIDPNGTFARRLSEAHAVVSSTIPFAELIQRFRAEVDALYVVMSFLESERRNMEICFPSKLTDYTAIGLPLLICGPTYASAVRWAKDNVGVAEIAAEPTKESLRAAVERLENPAHRQNLAKAAIQIGEQYFSHAHAVAELYKQLRPK